MNKANQSQLVQSVNQQLVLIRGGELNYYLNLYQSFLTQSVVIGGFTYTTISQNTYRTENYCFQELKFCYYVTSVITIIASIHIIFSTMVMIVFSQGLALNGPLGSIAKSVQGLADEQLQIILCFNLMLISFAVSSVFFFWIIMEIEAAITSTIILCIATLCWYIYGERIYLRFYWNRTIDGWEQDKGIVDEDNDEPTLPNYSVTDPERGTSKKDKSFVSTVKDKLGINNSSSNIKHGDESIASSLGAKSSSMHDNNAVITEGYLTMKSSTSLHGIISERKKWHRAYGVLLGSGGLYIYKTRLAYRKDPSSPVYSRPLKIKEFYVKVRNLDMENRLENELESEQQSVADDAKSVKSATTSYTLGSMLSSSSAVAVASKFQLTLVPRENLDEDDGEVRNLWLLSTDTEEELDIWIEGFQSISPDSFNNIVT